MIEILNVTKRIKVTTINKHKGDFWNEGMRQRIQCQNTELNNQS